MKDFWEKRYSEKELAYGIQPNLYFKEQLDLLKPGKLLLPLEGEGRNAIYAAKKGWDVTAFDFSKKAREKTLQIAKEHSVYLTYKLADVSSFSDETKYDAIGLIFAHLPPTQRKEFHDKCIKYLNPNGVIISQHFHPNQLNNNYSSGGPKEEKMLYSIETLKADFKKTSILDAEEKEIELNEGKYHQGKAFVTNFTTSNKVK